MLNFIKIPFFTVLSSEFSLLKWIHIERRNHTSQIIVIYVIILCVRLDPRSKNTLFVVVVEGHPVYIDNLPSLITNINRFYSFSLVNM